MNYKNKSGLHVRLRSLTTADQLSSIMGSDDPICKALIPRFVDLSNFLPSCFLIVIPNHSSKVFFSIVKKGSPLVTALQAFTVCSSLPAPGNHKTMCRGK